MPEPITLTVSTIGKLPFTAKESSQTPQQEKNKFVITGVVTDSQGESVIGASVRIKDTTNGVITDMDGRYTITAPGKTVFW